jgi:protein gp37
VGGNVEEFESEGKMGIRTSIEYCDSSCNPCPFCDGCELRSEDPKKDRCYASNLQRRYGGKNKGWPKSFTAPTYFLERIEEALKWKDLTGTERHDKPWLDGYPRIVFVNDTGDGFCPSANPRHWLVPYLWRMANSPHIWLLLTKWPIRMMEFAVDHYTAHRNEEVPQNILWGTTVTSNHTMWRLDDLTPHHRKGTASHRIVSQMRRWVSFEPLLGKTDPGFRNWARLQGLRIDWVAAGGESGHNARPCHPDWARLLRDDCKAAGIPWFWKQNGEWAHETQGWGPKAPKGPENHHWWSIDKSWSLRVGKKAAGRILDGREHNGMFTFPVKVNL